MTTLTISGGDIVVTLSGDLSAFNLGPENTTTLDAVVGPQDISLVMVGEQGMAGPAAIPVATNPVFSYDGTTGLLSRIDYADGSFKLFVYDAGHGNRLDHIDYTVAAVTTRKTVSYNVDGSVHAVTETTV